MLLRKINAVPVKIRFPAFSLLEVLISTTLGAFLLFLSASSYTDFYRNQIKQKELLYLQSEAHQILDYFKQHFQHFGYQGSQRTDSNFELFLLNGRSVNIPHKHCIIGFYDLNQDGCLGKRRTKTAVCHLGGINHTRDVLKEIFGFKVENKEIYFFTSNLDNCLKDECQKLLTHCNGSWSKLTEVFHFKVNKLLFSWKKENRLLEIVLELSSSKNDQVSYSVKSYVFIFN